MSCACGCRRTPKPGNRFVHGHNRGRQGHYASANVTPRLSRERANRKLRGRPCAIGRDCSKHLDVHHRNGDPLDNSDENLIRLCRRHHLLVHAGKLDPARPVLPLVHVYPSGRRAYSRA